MNIVTTRFGLIQASESELYQIRKVCLGSACTPSTFSFPTQW